MLKFNRFYFSLRKSKKSSLTFIDEKFDGSKPANIKIMFSYSEFSYLELFNTYTAIYKALL